MREAYRVARSGRPGPVVVDLYRDVIENQTAEYIPERPEQYCVTADSVAGEETVVRAVNELKRHKKICIWAGNGVKLAKASEELKALSKILCAPVVCTYNGIGGIDGGFENYIGPRSRHGSKVARNAIETAECVVVVGSSLTAISTNRWEIAAKHVIQFDIIPENIGRHYPVEVGVVGDAKRSIKKISDHLIRDGHKGEPSFLNEILTQKEEWRKEVFSGSITDTEASPVPPVALHMELEKILRENSVFVVDAGNPGAWTHLTRFPDNTTYMKPVNYGNMGFALGAALGCKEACPEKEVIALLGDGSLGMTLGELETIGREKLPIIILLVNDSAYGNIRQEELYKMGVNRYTGVDFPDIDYLNVAKALGVDGCIVRKASEIPAAFARARNSGKPFMVEVKLDGSYTVWPEAF